MTQQTGKHGFLEWGVGDFGLGARVTVVLCGCDDGGGGGGMQAIPLGYVSVSAPIIVL